MGVGPTGIGWEAGAVQLPYSITMGVGPHGTGWEAGGVQMPHCLWPGVGLVLSLELKSQSRRTKRAQKSMKKKSTENTKLELKIRIQMHKRAQNTMKQKVQTNTSKLKLPNVHKKTPNEKNK